MKQYKVNRDTAYLPDKESASMKMGKGGKTGGNFGKAPKKSGLILSPAKPAGKSR